MNRTKLFRIEAGDLVFEDASYDLVYVRAGGDESHPIMIFERKFNHISPTLLHIAQSGQSVTITVFEDLQGETPRFRIHDAKIIYILGLRSGDAHIKEGIEVLGGTLQVVEEEVSNRYAPLVRVEAGGQSEDFQDYMVCSFSPAESCCHFRRKFRNEDERLLKLMEGQDEATVTLFADPDGKVPKMRISGRAMLFILSNTHSRPEGVIEDLYIEGTIEYL